MIQFPSKAFIECPPLALGPHRTVDVDEIKIGRRDIHHILMEPIHFLSGDTHEGLQPPAALDHPRTQFNLTSLLVRIEMLEKETLETVPGAIVREPGLFRNERAGTKKRGEPPGMAPVTAAGIHLLPVGRGIGASAPVQITINRCKVILQDLRIAMIKVLTEPKKERRKFRLAVQKIRF